MLFRSSEGLIGAVVIGQFDQIGRNTGDHPGFGGQGDIAHIERPSGTEPKIKIYLFAEHKRVKKAEALLEDMSDLLEFIRE